MSVARRVLAAAGLLAARSAAQIIGFNYSACAPTGQENPSLAGGDAAFVCLSFHGKTTSVFQLKVDQYTALQVVGCECRGAAGRDRARPGARGGARR